MPQLVPPSKRVSYTNTTPSNLFHVHLEYILVNESRFPHNRRGQRPQRATVQNLEQLHFSAQFARDPVADLDRDQRVEPIVNNWLRWNNILCGDHEDGGEFGGDVIVHDLGCALHRARLL